MLCIVQCNECAALSFPREGECNRAIELSVLGMPRKVHCTVKTVIYNVHAYRERERVRAYSSAARISIQHNS